MNNQYKFLKIPFITGVGFLLLIVLIEFLSIIHLNKGLLVYTLDDPYIHLSLGQHIIKGHYGINNIEYSAPSSTILWPFILAPFSSYVYFPFLLNIIASLATVYIFTKILNTSFEIGDKRDKNILVTGFLIILILITNLVGLIFTGMEHSLQVFIVSVIAYGLITDNRKNKITIWLLIAIIIAPLIRYENMAVSFAAIIYLLLNGHIKKAISALLLILIFIGGFSLFLISMNLNPLPTSVLIKSYFIQSGGSFHSLLSNFAAILRNRQGIVLLIGAIFTLIYMLKVRNPGWKKLEFVSLIALAMHFIAGRYDWFNRYEIYILTFFILIALFLIGMNITHLIENKDKSLRLRSVLLFTIFALILIGQNYITGLFDIPIASNNIYEQQYQMHRFVLEYYKKPVAVNDLGYVSYRNDHYVLDLYGLASIESFNARQNENNAEWMQKLTEEKQVKLAMIYEDWFPVIPLSWIKIGTLNLGKRQVTPAKSSVAFYATNPNEYSEIVNNLHQFIKTLPEDVSFLFDTNFKIPVRN